MRPAVVADVGNTRIKWGRCSQGAVLDSCSLPHDDPAAWAQQCRHWQLGPALPWAVTSVQPDHCSRLVDWLQQNGHTVQRIDHADILPLQVLLDRPDHVGMDRLITALAVNSQRPAGVPAAVIDAGSAITVDWIDETGAFAGGAICPGLRLMALALHEHTALLPLIDLPAQAPPLPGQSTPAAMSVGIYWTAVGGIAALLEQYQKMCTVPPLVFLTGGDAALLHPALPQTRLSPLLTLEGIRLAAEALP